MSTRHDPHFFKNYTWTRWRYVRMANLTYSDWFGARAKPNLGICYGLSKLWWSNKSLAVTYWFAVDDFALFCFGWHLKIRSCSQRRYEKLSGLLGKLKCPRENYPAAVGNRIFLSELVNILDKGWLLNRISKYILSGLARLSKRTLRISKYFIFWRKPFKGWRIT